MRVLVVDDHPLYREGLVGAIDTMPGKEVVGEAADGAEAVRRTAELAPDVVVMDLHMPELNGVDATRAITASHPDVAVLVLTMLEGDDSVFAAVRAGAKGYLLKGADRAEIGRALDAVAHGEVVFSSSIAQRVLAFFAGGRAAGATPFPELTDREREVLDLVARGLTNAEIARRLVVSDKTVRNHVSNVFAKLHVAGRAEAVARARDAGLGV
ncbi:response regulator transcription factor [Nocardioides iriomotensis]|uniref:Response regulator transcription factor n=1 Tax=Nocardioides iriomotensis TaxID=715784 RepID=A0A4V1Z2F6_9ACTN|nr:response regulator transcription factor [Nocardioides iriomotensis]